MYSFIYLFFGVKTIYASEDNFLEYLTHQLTRIYNGTEIDYQQGLEIKQNYLNDSPTITVLTHGFGNGATCWSNDVNITSSQWYKYNSHSLINKLFIKANGNLNIYYIDSSPVSESDRYLFLYKKITYNNYQNSHQGVETAMIDDVSKHVVVVFNSSNCQMNNDNSYSEFHQLMDEISMQYKMHTGNLPILNLIGYSRGGIMNEASNISIRNLWNANYTEDADVNVIAYGALTSIDLFKEMINDIENDVGYVTTYGSIISGTIRNCVSRGSFNILTYNPSGSIIGGICGDTLRGTISYCSNYMTIKTYGNAGQIVGYRSSYVSILYCNEYGSVTIN